MDRRSTEHRAERSRRMVLGHAEMRSGMFSNQWEFAQDGTVLARMRRFPQQRVTVVELPDGTRWVFEPAGWGVVRALHDGDVVAEIHRRSWWGRRWEIQSRGFAFELVSRPALRRWDLAVGTEPVARLAGSIVSYNRLRIDADISVPLVAVLLAWQVICRPWEQASFAVTPVPASRPRVAPEA